MITATAKPVGSTIMGDTPAAITLAITSDEVVRKITRTDANGTAELIPNGANFMTTDYPGVGKRRLARTNLVVNPSGEVDASGWVGHYGSVSSAARLAAFDSYQPGGKLIYVTASAADVPFVRVYAPEVRVTPGTALGLRVWAAVETGNSTRLGVRFYSSSGSEVAIRHLEAAAAASFYAGRVSVGAASVPAGAVTARLFVDHIHPAGKHPSGTRMWVDGAAVYSAPTIGEAQAQAEDHYFDGSTAAYGINSYEWVGTAHASASRAYVASGWTVTDDAAALGPITYTITGASTSITVSFDNSAPAGLSAPVLVSRPWSSGVPHFMVEQITEYTHHRDSGTTFHEVIGADPLPTWGTPQRRSGSVGIWCWSMAQARAVESLVLSGLWMIRQPTPGLDLVAAARSTSVTVARRAGRDTRWLLTVDYLERAQPTTGRFM